MCKVFYVPGHTAIIDYARQIAPNMWMAQHSGLMLPELRVRYRLGDDPYDPHDNILAGAAYIRELFDRYGSPEWTAAYNAGPGRYEESRKGRPLPLETRAYVAALAPTLGRAVVAGTPEKQAAPPPDWRANP